MAYRILLVEPFNTHVKRIGMKNINVELEEFDGSEAFNDIFYRGTVN